MAIRVGLNGFGRIGRSVFRILHQRDDVDVVAVNDLFDNDQLAYLLKFDTVMGVFPDEVRVAGDSMYAGGKEVVMTARSDPRQIPWRTLEVDYVIECTGVFRTREPLEKHLQAGAKKVIVSAPGQDVDNTVVYGVNHKSLKPTDAVISNASCTTNCIAPVVKTLNDKFGINKGLLNTIHSYTTSQKILDLADKDMRRARAAAVNLIPSTTGAAIAVGLVLPELNGKLDGFSMRVPTINVSVVDLTFRASRATTIEEVNAAVKAASEGSMKGILGYNDAPLVSIDFNHDPRSSIFDAGAGIALDGTFIKVVSWYDNEYGYTCNMLRMVQHVSK